MLKEEIYFSDDNIFKTISEILSKNGLKETPNEAADKVTDGKVSFITVVYGLATDLAKQTISEKDFINGLQNKINVSSAVAQNILKDVKEKILPHVEKINIETEPKEEGPVTAAPVRLVNGNQNFPKRPERPVTPNIENPPERKPRTTKNITPPPEITKPGMPNLPKKPDSYREPIE